MKKAKTIYERIQILSKKREEKKRTLKKTENEKGYLIRRMVKIEGKKCPEMDTLKIRLKKKMNSIRHINNEISQIENQISILKEIQDKS